ncbi:MAG: S53 family peptidase, partial [Opitutaceae bacterium]
AQGLEVVEADAGRRTVRLAGPALAIQSAFGVTLKTYAAGRSRFRSHAEPVSLPGAVAPLVEAVLGLDTRPQLRPHFRFAKRRPGKPAPRAAPGPRPMTPLEVARLYDFPGGRDGTGQCIALIELGGGYAVEDLQAYFAGLGLAPPVVEAVSVLGGQNDPTGPTRDANGEVMLDIEVAGAIAPRARIAVYFAPNTDAGFQQAVSTAVHDRQRKPSVVSISWGGPEPDWAAQTLQAIDGLCKEAALLGVTICCAAGDSGSTDTPQGRGPDRVDFPASSPYVLGCGGTHLESQDGAITREVVWNDPLDGGATGGGVSTVFPPPDYQQNAAVPPPANPGQAAGRGVPDVAGNADPATGYVTRVDGRDTVVGGTSAVAPLWAGLVALINQSRSQPLGFINPALYQLAPAAPVFRDIVSGNNGDYSARTGWDACTGWGSPRGTPLLAALDRGAGPAVPA